MTAKVWKLLEQSPGCGLGNGTEFCSQLAENQGISERVVKDNIQRFGL
jgi:hypothetical protein